jgi:hypothetical protein
LAAPASLAAVITGHIALVRIKSNHMLQGRSLAIAGLIMGYSMLIAVIMMALIPVFQDFVASQQPLKESKDVYEDHGDDE